MGGGDDQHLADSNQHQGAQRVIDQRLLGPVQPLRAFHPGARVQTDAAAAGQLDAHALLRVDELPEDLDVPLPWWRLALLDWMFSEIDLIEADLPSSSIPPPTTAPFSNDCKACSIALSWLSFSAVEVMPWPPAAGAGPGARETEQSSSG
jgi:hypothetical protein